MAISRALLEEFLEDCKRLAEGFRQFGVRWSTYGEQLEHQMSTSQREELIAAIKDLEAVVDDAWPGGET